MKFSNKIEKKLYESSRTTYGGGLNTGDAWPDGIFTKYGETRKITAAGMPRGMVQVVAPAADSVYGGDGSKIPQPDLAGGTFKRTKITTEYMKSNAVINPNELRDDTPPLAPKQRVYGRRAFGKSPDYTIPRESANFITTTPNILVKPTSPPEGTKSGGIPSTPEPGSKQAGSSSGYRQLQKGGESILHGLDKLYIYKMMEEQRKKLEGSLPTKVKDVKKIKGAQPAPDSKKAKEFFQHHTVHNGPHITGQGAEHATYDFDDDDYEVQGGLQKRKDKQKRGYEPVESVNEKMGPKQWHQYMQYVFDTQFKTAEEKKMRKTIIKKINKGQKRKGLPIFKESNLGLTYKKGKTVKVKHKSSGKRLVIVDKPAVRKEYEKIGYFAESVNERKLSSHQKKAILIAIEMSGNMTGATKKIEKIKKGLSNDKKVKDALQLANESVNEVDRRAKSQIFREWNKFEKEYGNFFKAVVKLGKVNTKATGDKTDEKIFLTNFTRNVGKFYALMQSWVRGQNESVNEAVEPKGNMVKIAKVVKDSQATKLSGVMIDMQSANLLMKLWDAVSDKDKEKMNKMNARLLTTVIKKLWSRVNLKLPI